MKPNQCFNIWTGRRLWVSLLAFVFAAVAISWAEPALAQEIGELARKRSLDLQNQPQAPMSTVESIGQYVFAIHILGGLLAVLTAALMLLTGRLINLWYFRAPKVNTMPMFGLLLAAFAFFFFLGDSGVSAQEIGELARKRAEELKNAPKEISQTQVEELISLVQKLGGLLVVLVLVLLIAGARLINFDPFGKINANKAHGTLWLVFGVAFFAFIGWQLVEYTDMPMITHGSASEHGKEIDSLFTVTLLITGLVFVLVHLALFYYAWAYRGRPGLKALFYPDNHKLEAVWTIIPAIGISVMVIYGVTIWSHMNDPAHAKGPDVIQLEVVGEQFQWRLRYPGQDKQLGKYEFRLISSENPVGVNTQDSKALDDVVPIAKEIHLPVGAKVNLNIRAKDVLHGVYMPHFRVNLYAVPGAPANFAFKPTKTTEEMRKETGNPNFNYELACSQLCGSAHWNMRAIIVVESQEDYSKWLAAQPTIASIFNGNNTPTPDADAQASAARP